MSVAFGTDGGFGAERVVPIGDKALQPADPNALSLDSSDAIGFALRLLRTDTTADSGQGRGLGDDLIRVLKIPLFDLGDEFGNMDLNGTACNAGHVFTIEASVCLVDRHFLGITERNLVKIMRT